MLHDVALGMLHDVAVKESLTQMDFIPKIVACFME
jgi:hypothetical protein